MLIPVGGAGAQRKFIVSLIQGLGPMVQEGKELVKRAEKLSQDTQRYCRDVDETARRADKLVQQNKEMDAKFEETAAVFGTAMVATLLFAAADATASSPNQHSQRKCCRNGAGPRRTDGRQ